MAETNRGRVAVVPESTFGETPADPKFKVLRLTNAGLQYTKNTTESNELDSTRMLADLIEVSASSGGNLDFELSPASYDPLIEAVLGGARSPAIDLLPGTAEIIGGELHAPGALGAIRKGQWLLLQDWAEPENNGWRQVVSIAGEPDHVTMTRVVDESSVTSGTVRGQTVTNSVGERSFSVEESYLDVGMHRLFRGMRVSSMSLSFSAGSILTGSFNFLGTDSVVEASTSWLGAGTRDEPNGTPVMNASANVGDVIIDDSVTTACFQSIDLTIDNSLREVHCLGKKFAGSINYGRQMVSGSFTKLFFDWTTYKKMLEDDAISLSFGAFNADGGLHVHLPRVKLTSNLVDLAGGNDSDVQEKVDFKAVKSEDGTHQIRIDLAAPGILMGGPVVINGGIAASVYANWLDGGNADPVFSDWLNGGSAAP